MTSNAHETARSLVADMTEDEKLWCLDGDAPFWAGLGYMGRGGYHKSPFYAARVERLGLPGFAFSDGPRGVVVDRATCFPVSMARGATWDLDLEERIGEAIGRELRAIGADLYGGVCVNVLRHPAWGRAQETYGEDPHHVGEMGAALTRGIQRHAMACVKHFACNSMENARFKVDIEVDEVALHEVYLPHFKRIVDEGVAVVMSAYNSVNGEFCGDNRALLTDILRREWGFEGFVISDWIFGIRDAARSVAAGLDVEMPYRMVRADGLRDALKREDVTWEQIDRSIERVLSTLLRFDGVLQEPKPGYDVLANPEHRALAREAAAKSVVLLRNEPVAGTPVLPLTGSELTRVAVLGRLASIVNLGDGGSSDVWAPDVVTALAGIEAALPHAEVVHHDGSNIEAAAGLAREADVALVVVGYTYADEGEFIGDAGVDLRSLMPEKDDPDLVARFEAETGTRRSVDTPEHVRARRDEGGFARGGDRTSLRLREDEVALIHAVAAANPRVIVAIVAGSAVVLSEWDDEVPAIVQSWYAGMEGGHALADVLLGEIEVAGRLPFTVPASEAHLPAFDRDATHFVYDRWHGWWKLARDGNAPAYPFGFGLGYTTFDLVQAAALVHDGAITASASVLNTGARRGTEVVQVYARRVSDESPPRLIGFMRLEAEPGVTASASLSIPLAGLAERDTTLHSMVVIPGRYEVRFARSAVDEGVTIELEINRAA
jgi:beta-glucosidase